MRILKFRARDKRKKIYIKNMVNGVSIAITEDGVVALDTDSGDWVDTSWVPEQYTGLKDVNGKEIYEGDIIKVTSLDNDHNQKGGTEIMIVKFFMGNMCMCFDNCETGKPLYPTLNMRKEVIGNIHENRELL
ncbi:MAG: hypothetical protein KAV87_00330 [Desulfobacteraceae bacterium]|nr:hypothetical protein [Desulfobacteraceae bacterium]